MHLPKPRLLFIVLGAASLSAQQAQPTPASQPNPPTVALRAYPPAVASAANPPTVAEIHQLFDALHMREMLAGFKENFKQTMPKIMQGAVPEERANNLSEEDRKFLSNLEQRVYDEMLDEKVMSRILELAVPIYQSHLSEEDVKGAIAYYESPSGMHFLKESPAMQREMMTAIVPDVQARMKRVAEEVQQEIKAHFEKKGEATGPATKQ